jgi:CheY-like chemotaxis protein
VRAVPELTTGTVTEAAQRALAKLFTDYPPGTLTRPTLVPPPEETAAFKVRDTLIVPWAHGPDVSGFLVLRGLARPQPPNLGDAVALLAQPLWSRVVGPVGVARGAGAELTAARLRELGRLAAQLEADWPRPSPSEATSEAAAKLRAEADSERDAARQEAAEQRQLLEASRAGSEAAAKARADAESECYAARQDAAQLRQLLEASRAGSEAAAKSRADAESERDATRKDVAELRARFEASQAEFGGAAKARAQAESELHATRREAAELRKQLEASGAEPEAGRAKGDERRAGTEAAAKARAEAEAERDAARKEAAELRQRIDAAADAAAAARADVEAERDAAHKEAAELRQRLEAYRTEATVSMRPVDAAPPAERERDEDRATVEAAHVRAERAEASAKAAAESWGRSAAAFNSLLQAIRRTPFLPPTVRVSVAEAESLLDTAPAAGPKLARILLVDREAPMLEPLARELEGDGLEVLIAHHPDEATLYLKTPDARGLTALILDVLALRPDQNIAELVRGWRHDQPGLALFLTFRADDAAETERAQRLPSTATAGYLPRPLQRAALIDAVTGLARRATRR